MARQKAGWFSLFSRNLAYRSTISAWAKRFTISCSSTRIASWMGCSMRMNHDDYFAHHHPGRLGTSPEKRGISRQHARDGGVYPLLNGKTDRGNGQSPLPGATWPHLAVSQ